MASYLQAQDNLEQLEEQIQQNEGRVAELEATLPAQRERAAASIRNLYLFQQSSNGLIDLVLSADDFNHFIAMVNYLDIIQAHNLDEVDRLLQLRDELDAARGSLEIDRAHAAEEVDRAAAALAEAEATREALRQAAIQQAEAEAAQRAAAEQETREHVGETFTTASGLEVVVEEPIQQVEETTQQAEQQEQQAEQQEQLADQQAEQEQQEPAAEQQQEQQAEPEQQEAVQEETTQMDSREQFISVWGERINNYLAGTALSGYGYTFATAAYDCGVDPRWSPAISCVESSCGEYCFADHNAWGWGDVDWPDWETAIWGHVSGLASGYGYTNSYSAAATYCPPNASFWYERVSSEMYAIWPTDSL